MSNLVKYLSQGVQSAGWLWQSSPQTVKLHLMGLLLPWLSCWGGRGPDMLQGAFSHGKAAGGSIAFLCIQLTSGWVYFMWFCSSQEVINVISPRLFFEGFPFLTRSFLTMFTRRTLKACPHSLSSSSLNSKQSHYEGRIKLQFCFLTLSHSWSGH